MNIYKNESFMVRIIEIACTCHGVDFICFPFTVICLSELGGGDVRLSLFYGKGWNSGSKGITIVKYTVCHYSFFQSGSLESD